MSKRSILLGAHRFVHYARIIPFPSKIRNLCRRIAIAALLRVQEAQRILLLRVQETQRILRLRVQETQRILRLEKSPNPRVNLHRQIKKLITKLTGKRNPVFDAATIGEVWRDAPSAPPGGRLAQLPDPSLDGTHDFNIRVPRARDDRSEADTLVVYATIDFLFCWDRLEEDLDHFFADGCKQVIVILIVPGFGYVDFASHSYLLSIFISSIPFRKFVTRLEICLASERDRSAAERPLFRSLRLFATDAWQILRRTYHKISVTDVEPPTKFSALVISVQPRTRSSTVPRSGESCRGHLWDWVRQRSTLWCPGRN
jgi:hypothetical protein